MHLAVDTNKECFKDWGHWEARSIESHSLLGWGKFRANIKQHQPNKSPRSQGGVVGSFIEVREEESWSATGSIARTAICNLDFREVRQEGRKEKGAGHGKGQMD